MNKKTACIKFISSAVLSLFITTAMAEQQQVVEKEPQTVEEKAPPNNIQELKEAIAQLIQEKDLPAVV